MLRPLHILMLLLLILGLTAAGACAQGPEITDPAVAEQDPDFLIQGEYLGAAALPGADKGAIGAQVIALGKGKFDVVVLKGGLPGKGWDKSEKIRLEGTRSEQSTALKGAGLTGTIADDKLTLSADSQTVGTLQRTSRKSDTLGAKPAAGAAVLYGGKDKNDFVPDHGEVAAHISTDGNLISGVTSQQKFTGPYRLHLEFRLSYMPEARGQGRSNSGVYLHDCYEVQVLDSFGLEGVDNECGGIYKVKGPDVNMCLPPLVWQTYDIDFTPPAYDAAGKKTANARATIRHNGVVIHDNLELPDATPGRQAEGPDARPLHIQGHGNHVQYRNVWIAKQ